MIGYSVRKIKQSKWHISNRCLVPFDLADKPDITRFQALIAALRFSVFLVRWDSSDDSSDTEWWKVIFTGHYSFDDLKKKVRYEIRKGIANYSYRVVSKSDIQKDGYEVYKLAYSRYNTYEHMMSKEEFIESINGMDDCIEFRAVYAIDGNMMVAFAENIVQEKYCFMSTMWVTPEALSNNAGYFLIHEILGEYMNKREFSYVSDGSRNIGHETSIHDFLRRKFGFHNKQMRLNVVYHPLIFPLVKGLYLFRAIIPKHGRVAALLQLEKFSS
jgi:hypothetical protein